MTSETVCLEFGKVKKRKEKPTVTFPVFHRSTSQHLSTSIFFRFAMFPKSAKIPTHSSLCQDVVRHPRCGVGCRPLWSTTRDKTNNRRTRRPFTFPPPTLGLAINGLFDYWFLGNTETHQWMFSSNDWDQIKWQHSEEAPKMPVYFF